MMASDRHAFGCGGSHVTEEIRRSIDFIFKHEPEGVFIAPGL
jgi:hypothetical protein